VAGLATLEWSDVNGVDASNSIYVADAAAAATLAGQLKTLSNAKINNGNFVQPLDLTAIDPNTAAAANVETARAKMVITLSGAPAAAGLPRPTVTIQVPAPKGTYINGLEGDPTNADIVALLTTVKSNRGETMNRVERVAYAK
jgi:hypothetical protein